MTLPRCLAAALLVTGLITLPAAAAAQPLPASLTLEDHALAGSRWHLRYAAADSSAALELVPLLAGARRDVESFFGAPFPGPVTITVVPDRATFTAIVNAAWGMSETACWMVASGVADFVVAISPGAWKDQACEHDPTDTRHVAEVLTHELVHAYHGQQNPTRDFTGMDPMGWFIEGVAVLAAGQLDRTRMARPEEAVRAGAVPASLEAAWSGRYRYGVSGSLVQFVDSRVGRGRLRELLAATDQEAVLRAMRLTEGDLLRAWQDWVSAGRPAGP